MVDSEGHIVYYEADNMGLQLFKALQGKRIPEHCSQSSYQLYPVCLHCAAVHHVPHQAFVFGDATKHTVLHIFLVLLQSFLATLSTYRRSRTVCKHTDSNHVVAFEACKAPSQSMSHLTGCL